MSSTGFVDRCSARATGFDRGRRLGRHRAFTHFADREALFLAAFDLDVSELLHRVAPDGHALAGWIGIVPRTVAAAAEHPLAARALRGEGPTLAGRLVVLPGVEGLRTRLRADLARGAREGTIRTDVDAERLADGIVALLLTSLLTATQIQRAGAVAAQHHDELRLGLFTLVQAATQPV